MRLLFITATRVGDAVLSTGLLDRLLQQHPGARVTVAVGAPGAPILAAVPGLEDLIVVRKRRRGGHWRDLWRRLAGRRWDLAVDLRASLLTYALLARHRLVAGRADPTLHRVVELGRLARLPEPPAPRLWLTAGDRGAAAALLPPGPFLALAPTANWVGKQWPAERFAALARQLTGPGGPLAGLPVVAFGAEHERPMAAALLQSRPPGGLIDLVGRTPLPVAGACLERARLFVGNDSGLMHLAAAAGTPTLGLFGPTPEARYGPWGPRAAVVRGPLSAADIQALPGFAPDAPQSFMEGLEVAAVAASAERLLARSD